jgi:Fic family protein
MKRESTGKVFIASAGGEQIRAFVPSPLPPTPALDLSGPRQVLLERATAAVGRLDSIGTLLPDPHLFLYSYVRREAVLSSQIEGTQSSLSDLLLFELHEVPGTPVNDVTEVSNYVAALHHGMNRIREGFPLCNRLLREMHEILMAKGRGSDKDPGEFRRIQNWIGGTRPGNARFVPPPPHEVGPCMAALENYVQHEAATMPVLLRAALAHVQFETIHPFLDGNGRLGRLLIAMLLHHGGLLSEPLLYLSLYLKQHRDEYYELLNRVRTDGEWEAWIDFFLEGVVQTASSAVETAKRLVERFDEDAQCIKHGQRQVAVTLRMLDAFRHRPLLTISRASDVLDISFPTASKIIDRMIDLGILRELTGQRRNRIFVYDAYLNILNEGG